MVISDNKRIGIFGGTFNPVHYGHLRIALEFKRALRLDEMRLMICSQPPHREAPNVNAEQRLNMLQLALEDSNEFILDDRELRREGPSYSVDTLRSLKKEYPDACLFMMIGSDSFQSFDTWHEWQEILELTNIVIARRPENIVDTESSMGLQLKDRFVTQLSEIKNQTGQIIPLSVTQLDISSTQVRQMLKEDVSCKYLMPDSVINYIEKNSLYKS